MDAISGVSNYEIKYRVLFPDDSIHYIQGKGKLIRVKTIFQLLSMGLIGILPRKVNMSLN